MFDRRPPQRREFVKKSLALLIAFVLFVSTAAPALSQLRVSGAGVAPASSKKNAAKAKASKTARKKDEKSADSEITPERLSVEAVSVRTTSEIMAEQAARGTYKSAREIVRESGVKRTKKVHPDRANITDGPWRTYDADRIP